jgi:hypothetical protein
VKCTNKSNDAPTYTTDQNVNAYDLEFDDGAVEGYCAEAKIDADGTNAAMFELVVLDTENASV